MRIVRNERGASWFDIFQESNGQVDVTYTKPGVVRAFHLHNHTSEWIFIVKGEFKFVMTNPQESFLAQVGDVVKIEPGRWHGFQNISEDEAIYVEYADRKFDTLKPDDELLLPNTLCDWDKEAPK